MEFSKVQMYCRLESATCQTLPPGLRVGSAEPWTCIPDVYNELSDPLTTLNDCDCNCGGVLSPQPISPLLF